MVNRSVDDVSTTVGNNWQKSSEFHLGGRDGRERSPVPGDSQTQEFKLWRLSVKGTDTQP